MKKGWKATNVRSGKTLRSAAKQWPGFMHKSERLQSSTSRLLQTWRRQQEGRIKHSLYSQVERQGLEDYVKRVAQTVQDAMNLLPELELSRAMLLRFLDPEGKIQEDLNLWTHSFSPAIQSIITSNDPKVIADAVTILKRALQKDH